MPLIAFAFTDAALDFLSELPPKVRRQVVKKAKALHLNPHPPTSKKLQGIETAEGEPVYRERAGDYRILYVVRSKPAEVLILDIDHRKDVYRMPKTKTDPADKMRMKEVEFDEMMRGALEAPPPAESSKKGSKTAPKEEKRLSAYPRAKNRES